MEHIKHLKEIHTTTIEKRAKKSHSGLGIPTILTIKSCVHDFYLSHKTENLSKLQNIEKFERKKFWTHGNGIGIVISAKYVYDAKYNQMLRKRLTDLTENERSIPRIQIWRWE